MTKKSDNFFLDDDFIKPLSFDDDDDDDNEDLEEDADAEEGHANQRSAKAMQEDEEDDDEDSDDEYVPNIASKDAVPHKDSFFVFSFGTASSGKSVILSSMLYAMQTQFGILSPREGVHNSREAEVLLSDFFSNMSEGVLPERTERDKVTRMDLTFRPNHRSKKVRSIDITFLESSGENWGEVRRGGKLHSSIDAYLSSDIPLIFMLVTSYRKPLGDIDATMSNSPNVPKGYRKEDAILRDFLFALEKKRPGFRNTKIILIISQWDKKYDQTSDTTRNIEKQNERDDPESFENELDEFIKACLPMTYSFMDNSGLDKTYYTVGDVVVSKKTGKERIKQMDLDAAQRLAKWLYYSITGYPLDYKGTFWERVRWSLGMK